MACRRSEPVSIKAVGSIWQALPAGHTGQRLGLRPVPYQLARIQRDRSNTCLRALRARTGSPQSTRLTWNKCSIRPHAAGHHCSTFDSAGMQPRLICAPRWPACMASDMMWCPARQRAPDGIRGLKWAYVPYIGECFCSAPHIQLAAWKCTYFARRLVPRLYCLYAIRLLACVYERGPFMHPLLSRTHKAVCNLSWKCFVLLLVQSWRRSVRGLSGGTFFPQGLPASLGAPRCQHGDVLCSTEVHRVQCA